MGNKLLRNIHSLYPVAKGDYYNVCMKLDSCHLHLKESCAYYCLPHNYELFIYIRGKCDTGRILPRN